MQRRPRLVFQPVSAFSLIACKPFVASLAAHPEPPADRRKRLCVFHNRIHKSHPLFHGAGFFPNHRQAPPCRSVEPVTRVSGLVCYLCSRLGPPPNPSPQGGGEESAATSSLNLAPMGATLVVSTHAPQSAGPHAIVCSPNNL